MSEENLKNLVKIGQLKVEEFKKPEFIGLVGSARKRLADARNKELSPESRFDLAYNAAHGFALAALRYRGYRTDNNRRIVFQALSSTLGLDTATVRVFSKAHDNRNLAEYEGDSEVDEKLLADLIHCATKLEKAVSKLPDK